MGLYIWNFFWWLRWPIRTSDSTAKIIDNKSVFLGHPSVQGQIDIFKSNYQCNARGVSQNSFPRPSTVWIPLPGTIPTTSPGYLPLTNPDRYGARLTPQGSWQDQILAFLALLPHSIFNKLVFPSLQPPSYLCYGIGLRHSTGLCCWNSEVIARAAKPSEYEDREGTSAPNNSLSTLLRYVALLKILTLVYKII